MSLLSSFIAKEGIAIFEKQFIENVPAMQDLITKEVESFAQKALEWVKSKSETVNQQQG